MQSIYEMRFYIMLFKVMNNAVSENLRNTVKIVKNKKYGIISATDNTCILSEKYDNIFCYGKDVFVVHKKGKIGVIRIENDKVVFVADCEFDTLESRGHDLLLCNNEKVRYYNSVTKTITDFIDVIVDYPCLYCKDEKHQYILYGELGEEIYKKEYTSYSESCFCFCGETDLGPVFYDARYSSYLYPTKEGYEVYRDLFNHPIVFNRKNISNITEGEQGIGMIDSYGNTIVENNYDSIEVELKITAKKGNVSKNKIIPFQKIIFQKGMVSDIENWI